MQLPSVSLISTLLPLLLLLPGNSAAAPSSSLLQLREPPTRSCTVDNHFFYFQVSVSSPPTDTSCGDRLLSALSGQGLMVTQWKCEAGAATFNLHVMGGAVQSLATAISSSCDTYFNGNLWAKVDP